MAAISSKVISSSIQYLLEWSFRTQALVPLYDKVTEDIFLLPPPETQATYGYSATTGRLETVSNGTSSFRYDYLANSSLLEHVVATAGAVHDVHLAYEPTRNVLASRQNKVGTNIISQYDYTVNSIGQRSAVAQVGTAFQAVRAIAWQYDSLGQVIQADSSENTHDRAYQFDAIGNRLQGSAGVPPASTETTYLSNSLNQYQTITTGGASLSPAYDFDGNMTSGPLPAAPTVNSTLVWDAENRLIETTIGTNGPLVQNYYDSQSRRIATTSGGETTVYVYDSWNCVAEYSIQNSTFSIQHSNLWGTDLSGSLQGAGGVGGLLVEKQGTNTYFPTFDGNGNVSEYLTSTGAVAAHFEYDPFGNTVVNTDTTNQFAYRFSTKPQDLTTGLLYYGYRWYDAVTGRWPSRDPIQEIGGVNLYGFAWNSSIDWFDDFGAQPRQANDQRANDAHHANVNGRNSNKTIAIEERANKGAAADDEPFSPSTSKASAVAGLPEEAKNWIIDIQGYLNVREMDKKCQAEAEKRSKSEGWESCHACCIKSYLAPKVPTGHILRNDITYKEFSVYKGMCNPEMVEAFKNKLGPEKMREVFVDSAGNMRREIASSDVGLCKKCDRLFYADHKFDPK